MEKVILEVKGGIVTPVIIPDGVEVIVRDFDTDGVDKDKLKDDGYNNKYTEEIYTEEDV